MLEFTFRHRHKHVVLDFLGGGGRLRGSPAPQIPPGDARYGQALDFSN